MLAYPCEVAHRHGRFKQRARPCRRRFRAVGGGLPRLRDSGHLAARLSVDTRQPLLRRCRHGADQVCRRTGRQRPGGRGSRPARVLRDAGDPDGGQRRHHGTGRARLGRRGLPRSQPRHHGVAGTCRGVRAGGNGSGRAVRTAHRRHVRPGLGHIGSGRREHPHAELVQPRLCGHFHPERCIARLRGCLVAAVDRGRR